MLPYNMGEKKSYIPYYSLNELTCIDTRRVAFQSLLYTEPLLKCHNLLCQIHDLKMRGKLVIRFGLIQHYLHLPYSNSSPSIQSHKLFSVHNMALQWKQSSGLVLFFNLESILIGPKIRLNLRFPISKIEATW